MAGIPKKTVEDNYTRRLTCAICGRAELFVQHLPDYPDFVSCRNCNAAFVVEDAGERVMYGKIPDRYPETTRFALRQWVWLEAVDRKARDERPRPAAAAPPAGVARAAPESAAVVAEPEPPVVEPPEEEFEAAAEVSGPDPDWLAARLQADDKPPGVPTTVGQEPYPGAQPAPPAAEPGPTGEPLPAWMKAGAAAAPPAAPMASPPDVPAAGVHHLPRIPVSHPASTAAVAAVAVEGVSEPPPTHRHRVVIRGDRLRMPINACAHCQRTPAPDRLPVDGSLPRQGDPGRRRSTTFLVPLCRDCSRRANLKTSEQRNATLMAHLIGALVGLVLVVVVLAAGVIRFESSEELVASLVMLGVAWFLGYGITAALMLRRARRIPPSADASYVRTTLRVVPDEAAAQTAFEWRNRETAVSFSRSNGTASLGEPAAISEAPVAS